MNKIEQQAIETAIENNEVLRARLAKYEDADGKALGVVVPEGWAIAPSEIHLSAADIELISAMCGDGDEEAGYGPYQDGTLIIGYAKDDEGQKVYGLHLSCDECAEEGVTTLAEFATPKPADHSKDGGWIKCCERMPDAPLYDAIEVLVAVRRSHDGKVYVFTTEYLNRYPVIKMDQVIQDDDNYMDEVTGWYYASDDEETWHRTLGEDDQVIAWQPKPPAPKEQSDE
ncbi:hypothetical protein [Pseudomonas sp. TMP25]|uniref:hypothetical protein n=1 Tax=Pseudomonas sp. TMP25 TaxID=3136561 RepID=UPI0031018BB7